MRTQTWDKEIINYARDLMDQVFQMDRLIYLWSKNTIGKRMKKCF